MVQTTTLTASGKTGTDCTISGPYRCSTSPVVTVFIKKGDKFPPGPTSNSTKGQITTWTLVR
jgi:hypothetical protein